MVSKCVLLAMLVGATLAYPRPRAQPRPQHTQQPQQLGIPPHLLRQYLAEAQQQRDSTPIYEQEGQNTQVLPPPGQAQQIRYSPVQRLVQRVQQPQYQPQYQPQGQVIQYPQPAPPAPAQSRPQPGPLRLGEQQEQQQPEDYDPNPSYQFGFDVNDDQYTNYQNRKEQREGNVIKGSYSVVDSDGFIRTVTYTADPKEGFKAEVSRQPTDIVVKVPTPKPQEQQPLLRQQQPLLRQQQPQQQQPQQYYRYN